MDGMTTSAEMELPAWLNAESNAGYGPRAIPDPRDEQIASFVRKWMALDAHARHKVSASITQRQQPVLLAFGERMASRAVRESSTDWIVLGLVAIGLDGWSGDWRESVAILALHHDACERVGVSPGSVFAEAGRHLPLRVSEALSSFLQRDPGDRSLDSMLYVASSDEDGFRYKSNW
jgi:hypothetical protein